MMERIDKPEKKWKDRKRQWLTRGGGDGVVSLIKLKLI
jgi:hypothetical protein